MLLVQLGVERFKTHQRNIFARFVVCAQRLPESSEREVHATISQERNVRRLSHSLLPSHLRWQRLADNYENCVTLKVKYFGILLVHGQKKHVFGVCARHIAEKKDGQGVKHQGTRFLNQTSALSLADVSLTSGNCIGAPRWPMEKSWGM